MNTTAEVLAAIREFSELARRSRLEGLTPEDQTTMDDLEQTLRQVIDGAAQLPQRGYTPRPASPTEPADRITRDAPDAPRKATRSTSATPPVRLSQEDARKVNTIATRDLPASPYTPPTGSLFLANYYRADLTPATVDETDDVINVVDPAGTRVDLDREVQILLGVESLKPPGGPKPSARVPPDTAPTPAGRPGSSAAAPETRGSGYPDRPPSERPPERAGRHPVLIYLVTGETVRGSLEAFAPTDPTMNVTVRSGQRLLVTTRDILAVFFATPHRQPPAEPTGHPLVVTMVNGRKLRGRSSDYVPGGAALTLALDPPHRNVDSVWVPAWAVRGIEDP